MLKEKLRGFKIILASGSPRRQQFFRDMELDFEVQIRPIKEAYPNHLKSAQISDYLAELKASVFRESLLPNDILITSDTVVWHDDVSLAKPKNKTEAFNMLSTLSDDWHEVITSVCFTTISEQRTFHDCTLVKFKKLSDEEINHYINTCQPFDGVEEIQGSFYNVMGLPTHLVYKTLMDMVG